GRQHSERDLCADPLDLGALCRRAGHQPRRRQVPGRQAEGIAGVLKSPAPRWRKHRGVNSERSIVTKLDAYRISSEPFYRPVESEIALFEAAHKSRMPVMLKG